MDLSAIFTDDQLGLIGSFVAMALCGALAALSFRFGPARNQTQTTHMKFAPSDDTNHESRKAA